ncbi:MAG: amino acid adenylation domain-containing protein, partial [Halanaerobiales bacterium]|nr:amino acid adenylation domain-containing protein [Halanaerobiales bacterium]
MDNRSNEKNKLLFGGKFDIQKNYWLDKLECVGYSCFPYDYKKSEEDLKKEVIKFSLPNFVSQKIFVLSNNSDFAIFTILLSIFKCLIYKYVREEDVLVGTTIFTKESDDTFLNKILAFRDIINPEQTCKELLIEVRKTVLEANKNQNYPLDEIFCDLDIPLFKVGFILENIQSKAHFENYDLDITLSFIHNGKSLEGKFKYNPGLYKKSTIEKISSLYIKVGTLFTENINTRIEDIELLTTEEKNQLLYEFNGSKLNYATEKTFHQLFEEQVERSSGQTSLIFEDQKLTYKELNNRANQLAKILRAKGVKQDQIVGLLVHRSLEMFIGILGILKAGGAYLPLDPDYPTDRIKYMLEDSNASWLLVDKGNVDLGEFSGECIDITDEKLYIGDSSNLVNVNQAKDLAYVIYTSGSTGKPKGVMIEHQSLHNFIVAVSDQIEFTPGKTILSLTTFSFDLFVSETLLPLARGMKLVIANEQEQMTSELFNNALLRNDVDMLHLTPSRAQLFISDESNLEGIKNLKEILIGGEAFPETLLEKLTSLTNAKIYNMYGPTEATVWSLIKDLTHEKDITIGKPIANTDVYIFDENLNLVPINVPGDLYIAGDGLARGYLNNQKLTEERFVVAPFGGNKKMYKTGDTARWLPNEDIDFLGRSDYQVKIRGYRVELGEIEKQIVSYPNVKDAVVVDKEDETNFKVLVAYIVIDEELSVVDIRTHLTKILPDYMIPSYFIKLDHLPLTPNGKLDRKGLPKLDKNISSGREYIAPTNEKEKKLVNIFSETLEIKKIGIKDNFFESGGHSLKATTLISKIYKEFSINLPLRQLFESPTVEGLAKYIDEADESVYQKIELVDEREYYELSSAQKRLFALNQISPDSTNYNILGFMYIEGNLNIERLERTFNELIKRYDSFRTSFEVVEGEVVQKIHQDVDFKIITLHSNEDNLEKLAQEFVQPFDLRKAPLLRVGLVNLPDKYLLMFDLHHIIADGASLGILTNEFISLYQGDQLPDIKIQYKDFAVWQNDLFQSENIKKQEEYWLEVFKGEIPVLNLTTDYPRPNEMNFEGARLNFELSKDLSEELNKLAVQNGATMYMTLLALYNILLSKYTAQEDILIGSPIAGRTHIDLDNIIGMFVNTLVMRNRPIGDKTFIEFLGDVKENTLLAFENQDYPFEMLVDKLNLRSKNRNPLFDTMFVLQNAAKEVEIDQLKFTPYTFENKVARFDLTLACAETKNGIVMNIEYRTQLFQRETIAKFKDHFINLIKQIVYQSDQKIRDIEIISQSEKEQILNSFNARKLDYPKDKYIYHLFEEQVERTPDNIALIYKDDQLTYEELNNRSNQLARLLREKGIGPDQIVGIMLDRSFEMIIGIMGILKAGGAYLPIDPVYPEDRIAHMLNDSQAKVLLTQNHLIDGANRLDYAGEIIDLNDEDNYIGDGSNLKNITRPEDLAYIIYTSGSTGKPKGVMIEHKSIINRLSWMQSKYAIGDEDTILQKTPFTFDVSVWEFFWWFFNGSRIAILVPGGEKEPETIVNAILKYNVTTMHFVPSMLNAFLEYVETKDVVDKLQSLSQVFASGEALTRQQVIKFNKYLNQTNKTTLHNLYGPTEATVDVTYYDCPIKEMIDTVPIGKPIDNISIYIVDNYNNPVAVGVPGELCIAGVGVARGYLNRPELTEEKFVQNPFESGKRMYRTGDLARWLADGNIEYLGRIDNQVKIRGFRIELGEIENQLLKDERIKEAVVVDRIDEAGDKYLCAYITEVRGQKSEVGIDDKLAISDIRLSLAKELPDYMIPAHFVKLAELPKTTSGKVDRKALPKPDGSIGVGTEYVAPTNEIEEKLVAIWSEVLRIEKIGINDNFFELGGHSLKAMTVVSKVFKELNVEISLGQIFKTPTIKGLAELIKSAEESIYSEIEPVDFAEYYALSSAQKRLFLLNQIEDTNTSYNMPGAMLIEGDLDKERMESAFRDLIKRHEILRTSFELIQGEPVQRVQETVEFNLEYFTDADGQIEELMREFVKPFDLSKAPLLRVGLIKVSDKHVLIFDMHHIISDGSSMGILAGEVANLYEVNELEELRIQYKDFSAWQNELFESEKINNQEEYWLDAFAGVVPVLNILTDYPRPVVMTYEGDKLNFEIGEELTAKLNSLAQEQGATMYMVLLAAYNILLSKYSGQEDIIVGSPIAGRPHADLENMIGMFVNTLAMINYPVNDISFLEFLKNVKDNTLKAFENQDYQF